MVFAMVVRGWKSVYTVEAALYRQFWLAVYGRQSRQVRPPLCKREQAREQLVASWQTPGDHQSLTDSRGVVFR